VTVRESERVMASSDGSVGRFFLTNGSVRSA
jgi:hypothetical protein